MKDHIDSSDTTDDATYWADSVSFWYRRWLWSQEPDSPVRHDHTIYHRNYVAARVDLVLSLQKELEPTPPLKAKYPLAVCPACDTWRWSCSCTPDEIAEAR